MQDDNIMDNHLKPSKMRSVSNMQKLFIVVVSFNNYRKDKEMRKADTLEHAMGIVVNLDDEHNVESLFSVDENGYVVPYEIVFDRRLIAKPITKGEN